MKALLKTLIVVLALGILFTGCKKDTVEPDYFQLTTDTTYALSWGALYSYGEGSGYTGYAYKIYLCSSGMVVNESGYWSGSGDFIMFELSSATGTGIASGEYVALGSGELSANHFDGYSCWGTGWNTSSEVYGYLNSGTLVVVNKGDDNYELTFNGTDTNGNSVKAHYDGSIDYSFTESKKSAGTGESLSPAGVFGASK